MDTRTNRLIAAALLVAAGIAGGVFVSAAHLKAEAALATSRDVSTRLERMIATAGDIASAQQAYVAPGQPDQPWLERSATLLRQFAGDAAAVGPLLRSAGAADAVAQVGRGLQALIAIDGKTRVDLLQGQSLLAADLIFSEGRDTAASMIATLRDLGSSEQGAAATRRAALEHQQWAVLGVVGLVWVAGLVVLVPIPAGLTAETRAEPAGGDTAGAPAPIDLAEAAAVCASLARISDASALPDVLARAAAVLDARGIIVWLGAGEELFPALAYGYDARFVARLGAIGRHAGNATADAWRSGQMRTVASDVVSHGALAAPLSGVDGCVGVLAAEVRHGREDDPSTRAVATMFAAQLASIVSAWPAGSAAAPGNVADAGPLAASGGA